MKSDTTMTTKNVVGVAQPRLVSGSSERLAMEMLRTDMRITDARLSDAIDHEEGLRALRDAANDRVALLRSIKRDLQAKADSISSANAGGMARELAAQDSDNSNDING